MASGIGFQAGIATGNLAWECWTACIVAVSTGISSLELIALRSEFINGVYAEEIVRSRPRSWLFRRREELRCRIFRPDVIYTVVVGRLFASIALIILGSLGHISGLVLVVLAVSGMFINYRNLIGGDGSDQMSLLIVIALIPAVFFPNDRLVQVLCAWFIALQSALSYLVAGIAKVASLQWRSGECLLPILRTTAYGHPGVALRLGTIEGIDRAISWATIVFEISFPLVLFAPVPMVVCVLVLGVAFHGMNALLMGLNCFFWAFVAAYPAILFIRHV